VQKRSIEVLVGLFMLLGFAALFMLAMQISGLTKIAGNDYYVVSADFDNIGSLKPRSPVRIAGVKIGRVGKIDLDPQTYRARVSLYLDDSHTHVPKDSSASILTEGLLGSNYISVTPGFETAMLKSGDTIQNTHSALILENLIGQFIYHFGGGSGKKKPHNKK